MVKQASTIRVDVFNMYIICIMEIKHLNLPHKLEREVFNINKKKILYFKIIKF